jgi:hypothetical protein
VALGSSDTYALGVLAETAGLDVPIVVLPFVNSTLVGRESFRRSAEGVRILPGPADSSPESRRVRTYREHGGAGPGKVVLGACFETGRRPWSVAFRDLLAAGRLVSGGL